MASELAALPPKTLAAMENPSSHYSFGWSHGKGTLRNITLEIMNGKPDFAKGSFYNNPLYDDPKSDIPNYRKDFAAYAGPNVWPDTLTELRSAFMDVSLYFFNAEVGRIGR
jgi:hypothetical protein